RTLFMKQTARIQTASFNITREKGRSVTNVRLARMFLMVSASLALAIVLAAAQTDRAQLSPSLLQTRTSVNQITSRLERDLPPLMKAADVPGLSIALVRNGNIAWVHAFGVKDSKSKDPVTNETVFEAASLSKPVFALAVLK